MGLVAAVSLECGIHSLGEDGKVAWFSVGETLDAAAVDPLARWDLDGDWSVEGLDAQTTTIVLRGMPATLWLSARQHHDAILRELVLYLAEHEGAGVDHAGADAARALISTALVSAVEEAQASGRARPALPATHPSPLPWVPADLDLAVSVPVGSASWFVALQDTLDVAEGLAAAGELLMRPGLPEIVAVRDWACEQVLAQLSGDPPAPWPGTAQVRFETHVNDRDRPDELAWDSAWLLESDRGVVAADDANRIVAVSRPLASLIGWDPAALVGRRVVTIVPPSLREAHVAGFSRHLSTGESHVIGVPLELPVLHADGSEVPCRLVIERAPANAGRSVYLAWIDPLGSEG